MVNGKQITLQTDFMHYQIVNEWNKSLFWKYQNFVIFFKFKHQVKIVHEFWFLCQLQV